MTPDTDLFWLRHISNLIGPYKNPQKNIIFNITYKKIRMEGLDPVKQQYEAYTIILDYFFPSWEMFIFGFVGSVVQIWKL